MHHAAGGAGGGAGAAPGHGHHRHNRVRDEHPHYPFRPSRTPGGHPDARTSFDVEIGSHPPRVDLRETGRLPPVYNQGKLGSCTGNALAAALHFEKPSLAPSRLFIYFSERVLENDVADDEGACLADGIKALHTVGVCSETTWPYSDDKIHFKTKPPAAAYTEAAANKLLGFEPVLPDHDHLKAALASEMPVVLGITLYESFETPEVARTGHVPMPSMAHEKALGGHAVCMVGFDEEKRVWIIRNSWGPEWGDGGYFYLPYGYIGEDHLATDPWVVKSLT